MYTWCVLPGAAPCRALHVMRAFCSPEAFPEHCHAARPAPQSGWGRFISLVRLRRSAPLALHPGLSPAVNCEPSTVKRATNFFIAGLSRRLSRTLLRCVKRYLQSLQQFPHSLRKTTRGGVPLQASSLRARREPPLPSPGLQNPTQTRHTRHARVDLTPIPSCACAQLPSHMGVGGLPPRLPRYVLTQGAAGTYTRRALCRGSKVKRATAL